MAWGLAGGAAYVLWVLPAQRDEARRKVGNRMPFTHQSICTALGCSSVCTTMTYPAMIHCARFFKMHSSNKDCYVGKHKLAWGM